MEFNIVSDNELKSLLTLLMRQLSILHKKLIYEIYHTLPPDNILTYKISYELLIGSTLSFNKLNTRRQRYRNLLGIYESENFAHDLLQFINMEDYKRIANLIEHAFSTYTLIFELIKEYKSRGFELRDQRAHNDLMLDQIVKDILFEANGQYSRLLAQIAYYVISFKDDTLPLQTVFDNLRNAESICLDNGFHELRNSILDVLRYLDQTLNPPQLPASTVSM